MSSRGDPARDLTARLQAVETEIESLLYAISHDLRAPLRHIEGFVQILLEDHAAALPADAQQVVRRIAAGSARLSLMIDGVLRLSRVGRAELTRTTVDLTALAQAVVDAQRPPDRTIDIAIAPLPSVSGDASLLRQLLDCLVSNAVKFTRSTPAARIEIGTSPESATPEPRPAEPVFFVRDNGVGFDPEYAFKLFTVFQRLHTPDQFEGVGVGLCIAKRIVERHHGRMWIEGIPEKGATVFFTMGAN
jgi:light-regulated signal transduction histidine kinase (bacteriophytochrome)